MERPCLGRSRTHPSAPDPAAEFPRPVRPKLPVALTTAPGPRDPNACPVISSVTAPPPVTRPSPSRRSPRAVVGPAGPPGRVARVPGGHLRWFSRASSVWQLEYRNPRDGFAPARVDWPPATPAPALTDVVVADVPARRQQLVRGQAGPGRLARRRRSPASMYSGNRGAPGCGAQPVQDAPAPAATSRHPGPNSPCSR